MVETFVGTFLLGSKGLHHANGRCGTKALILLKDIEGREFLANGSNAIECFEKVHAILLNVVKIVVIEKRGVVGFEIKLFEKGTDRFGPCPGVLLFAKGIQSESVAANRISSSSSASSCSETVLLVVGVTVVTTLV